MRGRITGLAKNSVIYGLGTMLTRFIGLFLLPFFTAYLTPSDYGILALLALIGQVLQPVFALGLSAGMGPCYFEGNNEKTKAVSVWTAFIMLLISSSLLISVAFFFSEGISKIIFQSPSYAELVVLSLSGVAIRNLTTPLTQRMQFEGKALPFVLLTILSTLVSISLSVAMVIFLTKGVYGMLIAQLVGAMVNALLFFAYISPWTPFSFQTKMLRSLLCLGLPLVPSFAFLFILMHANKYLLQWFSGLDALGIYSIGFNFGMVMNLFTGSFQTAWFPYFMSFMEKTDEAKQLFGRIFSYYVAGFGSLVLVFFLFSRTVVTLMTQPAFHASYRIVGFAALAHFFIGIYSLLLPPIYFIKDVKVQSIIQGATCIPYFALTLPLISYFGALGAGIGLSLGFFFMACLTWLWIRYNKKYLQIPLESKRILTYALFMLPIFIISIWEREWSWRLETAFILTTLITLCFFLWNWFYPHERERLLHIVHKICFRKNHLEH